MTHRERDIEPYEIPPHTGVAWYGDFEMKRESLAPDDDVRPSHVNGRFAKGRKPTGGRQRGTINKTTALLKDAILMAAACEGRDGKGKDELVGYLRRIAKHYPKEYCSMLEKVLPYTIVNSAGAPAQNSYEDKTAILQAMQDRGLPAPVPLLPKQTHNHETAQ